MTTLKNAAKITTLATTTKKFILGSGLNLQKSVVQATQPEVSIPLVDVRVIVTPKTSKMGNDYLEVKCYGKNAITMLPESFEIGMNEKACQYDYALIFDPYRVFMKDENNQPVGTGFLHGKGFRKATEDEINDTCLRWQEQQINGTTSSNVADLLR